MEQTTIAALATPPGKGGLAVVRLSGPMSETILREIFQPINKKNAFQNRFLMFGEAVFEGETLDETRAVVAQYFAGVFGPPMPAVSEVTEREGALVAATLLTQWWGGPFVAFMVTAPDAQRQGLARAGLTRALNRLAAGDEPWLRLVVTQGNSRAEALYESLGFVPVLMPAFEAGSSAA